jgi:ketosteroid isomerase-like protein
MAAVAVAGALGGCGGQSQQDQVRAKVAQFVTAAAGRDYATICNRVLAPSLLTRLATGGISCPQAMQIGFGGVSRPALSIGKITVSGSRASVIALSTAQGQPASLDTVELTKTSQGWRIAALGSPPVARPSK